MDRPEPGSLPVVNVSVYWSLIKQQAIAGGLANQAQCQAKAGLTVILVLSVCLVKMLDTANGPAPLSLAHISSGKQKKAPRICCPATQGGLARVSLGLPVIDAKETRDWRATLQRISAVRKEFCWSLMVQYYIGRSSSRSVAVHQGNMKMSFA